MCRLTIRTDMLLVCQLTIRSRMRIAIMLKAFPFFPKIIFGKRRKMFFKIVQRCPQKSYWFTEICFRWISVNSLNLWLISVNEIPNKIPCNEEFQPIHIDDNIGIPSSGDNFISIISYWTYVLQKKMPRVVILIYITCRLLTIIWRCTFRYDHCVKCSSNYYQNLSSNGTYRT